MSLLGKKIKKEFFRMKPEALQRLMTVEEIADYLQVKPSTIYQWTHTGFIPHVKIGNPVKFKMSQIDRWIEKRAGDEKVSNRVQVI